MKTDSFVFFCSRFTCSSLWSSHISRINVTAKNFQQEQALILQYFSLFLRATVFNLLNKEAVISQMSGRNELIPLMKQLIALLESGMQFQLSPEMMSALRQPRTAQQQVRKTQNTNFNAITGLLGLDQVVFNSNCILTYDFFFICVRVIGTWLKIEGSQMAIEFVYGAGGLRFKSRTGRIVHSVANGSQPMRRFFRHAAVYTAGAVTRRWAAQISYTLRRNTAIKLLSLYQYVLFVSGASVANDAGCSDAAATTYAAAATGGWWITGGNRLWPDETGWRQARCSSPMGKRLLRKLGLFLMLFRSFTCDLIICNIHCKENHFHEFFLEKRFCVNGSPEFSS